MKSTLYILLGLACSSLALAQTKNVQKTVGTNNITEDLNVSSGRTLTISVGGTLDIDGTLTGGAFGTVTSVAVSGSDGIEVDSGSPVTTSGTIALGVNASTMKSTLSLGNVENTALSTWPGTANITTVGTIGTGAWNGTNISLGKGGTGAALTDPNADRLMFWDDSAGAVTWLTLGDNLSITGTTLNATGGGGGDGITALTGDVTASGTGSVAATLANTAVTPGTYGQPSALIVDAKGRITGINTSDTWTGYFYGANQGGSGGQLSLAGGAGGSGGNGGGWIGQGGDEAQDGANVGVGGQGGSIIMYGGGAYADDVIAYDGGHSGTLSMAGGDADNSGHGLAGGSITTSAGGGSIDTTGTGSLEMGSAGTRTTVLGAAAADWTLTLPVDNGTDGQVLTTNGSGVTSWDDAGGGSGDVVGPASSTDNTLARYDSTTGKLLQSSTAVLTDAGSLTLNTGAVTASAPVLALAQEWNNAAVTFRGVELDITETARASNSTMMRLRLGGSDKFVFDRYGSLSIPTGGIMTRAGSFGVYSAIDLTLETGVILAWGGDGGNAPQLHRDQNMTIAQRNGTSAQTYRLYETWTNASNYERLSISAASGTNVIKPEAAGTGAASTVEYHTTSTGVRFCSGSGSPESVVTAPIGSLYTRTDGGAGTTLYVKESGTGNTGWIAK